MNRRMDAMKALDEWLPRLRAVPMMKEPVQLLDDLQRNLEAEEADADTLIDQCWDRVRPMLEEAASHTTGWSHNTIDGVYKGLRYWFHRIPDIPKGTGQIRPPIVVQSPSFEPLRYPYRPWNQEEVSTYSRLWREAHEESQSRSSNTFAQPSSRFHGEGWRG